MTRRQFEALVERALRRLPKTFKARIANIAVVVEDWADAATLAEMGIEPPDTLDKDFIRRWVAERCDPYAGPIPEIPPEVILQASAKYVEVYEQLTGQELQLPDLAVPALARIRGNLRKYFDKAA